MMNSFGSKSTLTVGGSQFDYFSLELAEQAGAGAIARMPFSLKVMLENLLRFEDGSTVSKNDILALARSAGAAPEDKEIAFRLTERESQIVADIDQALLRIREGSYGVCARCQNPIDERRLEALPTARYDAQCQAIIESQNGEDDLPTL